MMSITRTCFTITTRQEILPAVQNVPNGIPNSKLRPFSKGYSTVNAKIPTKWRKEAYPESKEITKRFPIRKDSAQLTYIKAFELNWNRLDQTEKSPYQPIYEMMMKQKQLLLGE